MNRVNFLVDGFNLYHSVRRAAWDLNTSTKWLNIKALCSSYVYLAGRGAQLQNIYYFSALAKHLEASHPDVVVRHLDYIKCLEDTGIGIELSRFKPKVVKCGGTCGEKFIKNEEKETDVAIASKLLEIFHTNECDTAVLITGDTDLAPAVNTAYRIFPDKNIFFAFPYKRKNRELSKLAPRSFRIKGLQYAKHQFSDPYQLSDGTLIPKPETW